MFAPPERNGGADIVTDGRRSYDMKEFYRALNDDKRSLAESLQSAQRVLRESGRYRHPYFWSGYVLTTAANQAGH
jgi:CHAT domain-containing protein